MTVQDDAREQELCNLFNLTWDPMHARGGTDAILDVSLNGDLTRIEFEVKSSTTTSVSTARDVGVLHNTMERGATLNNPHITKSFLDRFADQRITADHAQALRSKLTAFLKR